MSQLNSKELLQNIRDVINAPKPPVIGQEYFTAPMYYAAINLARLTERDRIVIILQDNIADQDLYQTLIAAINGDAK